MNLKELARRPLVQFAFFGAALLTLRGFGDRVPPSADHDIEIALRTDLQRQLGRAPTLTEVTHAVDRWRGEEALFREALDRGLDRGDPIVRRRLVQMMQFILESEARSASNEPTDAEVIAWAGQLERSFTPTLRIEFSHRFFGPGPAGERQALAALVALEKGDLRPLDLPFIHGTEFKSVDRTHVEKLFGSIFASSIWAASKEEWSGPHPSSYGYHLVRVRAEATPDPWSPESLRRARLAWSKEQEAKRVRARVAALRRHHGLLGEKADP